MERRYRSRLRSYIKAIGRLTRERLMKVIEREATEINLISESRQDSESAIIAAIEREILGIRFSVQRLWTDEQITDYVTQIAGQMDLFEQREIVRQWSAVRGVDPILRDRATASIIRAFSLENLRLVKDMPDKFLTQVQDELVEAVRTGTRASEFESVIQERLGVAESRATLIARDQIGSMNGALVEARQRDLGVTQYEWSTSNDERVVGNPSGMYPEAKNPEMHGNHYDRDGQIYSWDHVHPDGHPGRPINCRCVAVPVIPTE